MDIDKVINLNYFKTTDLSNKVEWIWPNGKKTVLDIGKIISSDTINRKYKPFYVEKTEYGYRYIVLSHNMLKLCTFNGGTESMDEIILNNASRYKEEIKQFKLEIKLYTNNIIIYNMLYNGFKVLGVPKYCIFFNIQYILKNNKKAVCAFSWKGFINLYRDKFIGLDIDKFDTCDRSDKKYYIITIKQLDNADHSRPIKLLEYDDGNMLYMMPKSFMMNKNGKYKMKYMLTTRILNTKSNRKRFKEFLRHKIMIDEMGLTKYYQTLFGTKKRVN